MSQNRLRVYCSREEHGEAPICENDVPKNGTDSNDKVTVRLSDVLPQLADALSTNRAWLKDFQDDEITISSDLYGLILAYQDLRASA